MAPPKRQQSWEHARNVTFDVTILGGGINGACLYHRLCAAGYRVLLVDQGDFAAGTSQASGMMIWGGLLYLRRLDVLSVYRFSQARDAMIRNLSAWVAPVPVRYIASPGDVRPPQLVLAGLYFYWLLSYGLRRVPGREREFRERPLIRNHHGEEALLYEEGLLKISDARFVLHWITPHQTPEQVPLNYCALTGGGYDSTEKCWRLELRDTLGNHSAEARSRWVVNCAGVWADRVNALFGIETPYKHVLSKGVYLGVQRPPEHESMLVFEMGQQGDAITYAPWGPISLWGPTETRAPDLAAGRTVAPDDVRFLLEQAGRNLARPPGKADIISLRCGLRPLAVPKSFNSDCYTLDISRRHRIARDSGRPWISLYGGKITGCTATAEDIAAHIAGAIRPAAAPANASAGADRSVEYTGFPGLTQKVPSVEWCQEHEFCHTLEDYLRRRTNIAQWVAREGLGRHDENLAEINRIALTLHGGNQAEAAHSVKQYGLRVRNDFDAVLAQL